MKIMERKYISKNGVIERTRYAVGDNARPRCGRRKGNTSLRKQEQNFNTSLRKVARILNCNYSHEDGLLLTLDYSKDGLEALLASLTTAQQEEIRALQLPRGEIGTWQEGSRKKNGADAASGSCDTGKESAVQEAMACLWSAADHQMSLWLRRVKRKCSAKIKALMITSDIDHETGELVRIHHHIVLAAEGISWDLLQREWKFGGVDIRQLRAQPDYTPVAVYLMRQVRKQPEKKKYRLTQGMEQPRMEEKVILGHAEIRAPAGANVLERSEFSAEVIGQYIRYVPQKREYRRKRTADWRGEKENEIPQDSKHQSQL